MASNHIKKVAVVGAGGNLGSFITKALLKAGRFEVTAISRRDSKSEIPAVVNVKHVDYEKPETLVEALRGQDALVITLSVRSGIEETERKIVVAAGEAGVSWILPNEWSPDTTHEGLLEDVPIFGAKKSTRETITRLGKSSFIGVSSGFWYEYSLGIQKCYGFNFAEKKAQFYDDGETKICTSTWPQIGRAVAALLSLPIKSENSAGQPCLEGLRNQVVYINSFTINQKDMLASACRVTNTKESDWTITKVPSKEMYEVGMEDMKKGNWNGKGNFLYGRVFYPDGSGDFESSKGTMNEVLSLPKEDIDEATKVAVERQKNSTAH